jgi:triphosphoribosyl-dephospho-CoA synthase
VSQIKLTPGSLATLACLLEVAAPKPGNVHRGADFEDVTFVDFATSAVVLGEVIEAHADQPLGQTILEAVRQNEQAVGTNTNLGIVLLIVPLAKIAGNEWSDRLTVESVNRYLATLNQTDGAQVFEAIRLAKPGGLGQSDEMDVHSSRGDSVDLIAAMKLAGDRDAIARQYATGFVDVFETGVPLLVEGRKIFGDLSPAIVYAHVALMARQADSLISRKCGTETAEHSRFLASKAIECLDQELDDTSRLTEESFEPYWNAVGELDFWLRSDGHRRNPGTTADLIAASLFVGIHNGIIEPPFK